MNVSKTLAKGKKALTNVFSAATQAPRTMGQGVGAAIVAPFENRRLQTEAQTDRSMQDRTSKTDPQTSQRYADRTANNQEAFGRSLQQSRKKAVVGTLGTMATLYAAKAPKPTNILAKSRLTTPLPKVSKATQLKSKLIQVKPTLSRPLGGMRWREVAKSRLLKGAR